MINPNLKCELIKIGNEKTPVFIIDNFLLDPKAVIEDAIERKFEVIKNPSGPGYPGIRAPINADYANTLMRAIANIFYNILKVPKELDLIPQSGTYSLMNIPEADLDLIQCIPHYDSLEPYKYAILHYLNPGNFGGTGFYRHKPTGYENITTERKTDYFSSAQAFVDTHGSHERKYITDSTNHYELITSVDYKPNRLIIYPTTILHSAYVTNPAIDINDDPRTGRLSANLFIDFLKR